MDRTRRDSAEQKALGNRTRGRQAAFLERAAETLAGQRNSLQSLASDLRVTLRPIDLSPSAVLPLGWENGAADLTGHLGVANVTTEESVRVSRLPQLLPWWRSNVARILVIYCILCTPNSLITVIMSLNGITGDTALLIWFILLFPAIAAIAGGWVAVRTCSPRLRTTNGTPTPTIRPSRRYRLLAAVVAWCSWLVPGLLLDLLAPGLHR